MVTLEYDDPKTIWRRRAKAVGFKVMHGKRLEDMTETEVEAAFQCLSRDYGYSYTWAHP